MPYATQRDRTIQPLETAGAEWPAAPLNAFLTSGYKPGHWEIRWDDPGNLARNSRFSLYGVNIYRSFDSEFGPYELVTQRPLGATYWLDQTDNVLVVEEDVSNQFLVRGAPSAGQDEFRYIFRTVHTPVVKSGSQMVNADSPEDVQVFVDGKLAAVRSVFGRTGEIEIESRVFANVATQQRIMPVVPGPNSVVTCTYRYNKAFVKTDLITRTFYRLTTVAAPVNPDCPDRTGPLVETPLEYATLTSSMEIEKIDWMWREAVRRNRWILDQGGERVKAFLRKTVGPLCPCRPAADIHRQPVSDCLYCYGTGIVGGYEGPYDILIAPDDAERRISQKETGRSVDHTYEVFTGPSPLVSMRDFFVKINGERYSIGAVRMPTNRGMVLQQHFSIAHIDEKDIRNKVPMYDPTKQAMDRVNKVGPEWAPSAQITDKTNIPEERELRGGTVSWENATYAFPLLLLLKGFLDAVPWVM